MLLYKKGVQNKCDKYRGIVPFICTYKSATNYTKQQNESQCRKNNWLLPKGILYTCKITTATGQQPNCS